MDCPRCHGQMVTDRFTDLWDDSGRLIIDAWRCLNCGEVADPIILANRAQRPEPIGGKAPRRKPRLKMGS